MNSLLDTTNAIVRIHPILNGRDSNNKLIPMLTDMLFITYLHVNIFIVFLLINGSSCKNGDLHVGYIDHQNVSKRRGLQPV